MITVLFRYFFQKERTATTHLEERLPVQTGTAHVDHTVTRDGSRGGVVDVVRLEDDFTERRHGNTISVSQRESFVVVQNGVQILNPDGVHWPVQNQPDMLA